MVKRILALSLLMVGLAGCGSGDGGGADTLDVSMHEDAERVAPRNHCISWRQTSSVWTVYNGGRNGRYVPIYVCIRTSDSIWGPDVEQLTY